MILRSDLKSKEGAWWLIIYTHKFEQMISFSVVPSWFLKSLPPLIRNLFYNNFCGAIFKVRHCLTWEKVTDSRCLYSKPHGLYDWNPSPTKHSSTEKKIEANQNPNQKESADSPKRVLCPHHSEQPPLAPALKGVVLGWRTWQGLQVATHLLKG